jgi:hypothetical protein
MLEIGKDDLYSQKKNWQKKKIGKKRKKAGWYIDKI